MSADRKRMVAQNIGQLISIAEDMEDEGMSATSLLLDAAVFTAIDAGVSEEDGKARFSESYRTASAAKVMGQA